MKNPYRSSINGNEKVEYCVDGPGNGFGYNSWYLYPNYQFSDVDLAEHVSEMCNEAYRQGFLKAQKQIRESLGISK